MDLFSSNYYLRAGAGAFRLQFFVTRAGSGVLGSEFFHRAGAGAFKLLIFIPELELELRVLS